MFGQKLLLCRCKSTHTNTHTNRPVRQLRDLNFDIQDFSTLKKTKQSWKCAAASRVAETRGKSNESEIASEVRGRLSVTFQSDLHLPAEKRPDQTIPGTDLWEDERLLPSHAASSSHRLSGAVRVTSVTRVREELVWENSLLQPCCCLCSAASDDLWRLWTLCCLAGMEQWRSRMQKRGKQLQMWICQGAAELRLYLGLPFKVCESVPSFVLQFLVAFTWARWGRTVSHPLRFHPGGADIRPPHYHGGHARENQWGCCRLHNGNFSTGAVQHRSSGLISQTILSPTFRLAAKLQKRSIKTFYFSTSEFQYIKIVQLLISLMKPFLLLLLLII